MLDIKKRYSGLQDKLRLCGSDGCHFLTLLTIIEEFNNRPVDLVDAILVSQSKGWFTSDFEGRDATALLRYYTKKEWTRSEFLKKLPATIKENEYTEAVYFNPKTTYQHFRRRGIDTKENSLTVRDGYIQGYYIYTVRV